MGLVAVRSPGTPLSHRACHRPEDFPARAATRSRPGALL